jgi:hypothetical protein
MKMLRPVSDMQIRPDELHVKRFAIQIDLVGIGDQKYKSIKILLKHNATE